MIKKTLTSYDKAKVVARAAADKKGHNILYMDMRGSSSICDWFVIISATSVTRLKTIARFLNETLLKLDIRPLKTEGKENQKWVLVDYGDVIVHIFHEDIRDYYDLEHLWENAPKKGYTEKCQVKTSKTRSSK